VKWQNSSRLQGTVPTMGGMQLWADFAVCGGWRIQRHVFSRLSRLVNPQNRLVTLGSYERCQQRLDSLQTEGVAVWPLDRSIIFIIHGYGGLPSRFKPLSCALDAAGFTPVILTYPGLLQGVEQAAGHLTRILNSLSCNIPKISFVAHSMGALVVRRVLAEEDAPWQKKLSLGKAVLLAPANQGSQLAGKVTRIPGLKKIAGIKDLSPDQARKNPTLSLPFAIVAGTKGNGRGYNPWIAGEDDGLISLDETYLPYADIVFRVHENHWSILRSQAALKVTIDYLRK